MSNLHVIYYIYLYDVSLYWYEKVEIKTKQTNKYPYSIYYNLLGQYDFLNDDNCSKLNSSLDFNVLQRAR